jgi:HAD superfamily hydrolase (TIGR01549 family)
MSVPTLILNIDDFVYDLYSLNQNLWQHHCAFHQLAFSDVFFMGYYDAHLDKQEKLLREYRAYQALVEPLQEAFNLTLKFETPHADSNSLNQIEQLSQHYSILLLSNLDMRQAESLVRSSQLSAYPLYSTKTVLNGKPEPDVFLKIARSLNVKANELHVVESTLNGIQAAYLANAKSIFLNLYGEPISTIKKFSTYRVESKAELLPFLRQIV